VTGTTRPEDGGAPRDGAFEQERERLYRRVLTSVAHDLKTPLACIVGSLEICGRAKEKLTPENRDALVASALQEAYRLDDFVTNILDMDRMESGTVRPKKELCPMEPLLNDCAASLGPRLHGRGVAVRTVSAPFSVAVDPLLLTRAVGLVLDNAAKYAGPHPAIGMECEKIGNLAVIRIRDNGPGIPEGRLEEIFVKYVRPAASDRRHSGAGLGLSLCREIMRLLGGTVTASNAADGAGAVFTFTLAA
jgi:K+-sensing histidine kinase KdpD